MYTDSMGIWANQNKVKRNIKSGLPAKCRLLDRQHIHVGRRQQLFVLIHNKLQQAAGNTFSLPAACIQTDIQGANSYHIRCACLPSITVTALRMAL